LTRLARKLRDLILRDLTDQPSLTIDALHLLSLATLDIIGLAGFGYSFDAVSRPPDDPSELSAAVATMFRAGEMNFWNVLQFLLPPLRYLPSARNRSIAHSRAVMERIGRELLAERKASAACVFLSFWPSIVS
jgi:hypothetical protein